MFAVPDFGPNPGALDMYEHVPAALPANPPIVVVMHGCTQNASALEAAGWNALADEYKFIVVYPQQRAANQQLSCFTWYSTADTTRDSGEAASIIHMVDYAIAKHGGDTKRVFATGLSAGGAFTSTMLATYPERFAAGSVMAGLPYGCAGSLDQASGCQQGNTTKTPAQWGDLVRAASSNTGPWPRVQIWQGTADYTVAPANATELVKQWTNVWGTDQTADETTTINTATRTRYGNAVELYMIQGMGHAIATGDDPLGKCPATTGAFFANKMICSTRHAAAFFGLLGDDAPPPPGTDGGIDDPDPPLGGGGSGGCSAGGSAGLLIGLLALLLRATSRR